MKFQYLFTASTASTAAAVAVVAAVALTSAVPAQAVPAQAAPDASIWSIQPAPSGGAARPNINLTVDRGAAHEDAVIVSNFSAEPLTVRIYSQDAYLGADGGFEVRTGAETATDLGSWITMAAPSVTVPARSTAKVPFTISVPADAVGGDHAAGILTSTTSSTTNASGNSVGVEHRVGTRVYLRVAGQVAPGLELQGVGVDYVAPAGLLGIPGLAAAGSSAITYTVRNTGDTRITGTVHGQAGGPFGVASQVIPETPLPELLPGAQYTGTITVDGIVPLARVTSELTVSGSYLVTATTSQSLPPVTGSASGLAMPWAWLLLAIAAVGAFVIRWRLRLRNRPVADSDSVARVITLPADSVDVSRSEIDLRAGVGSGSSSEK